MSIAEAGIVIQRLRAAAEVVRRAPRWKGEHYRTLEDAGQALLRAEDLGFLATIPRFSDLASWARGQGDHPFAVPPTLAPCGYNLVGGIAQFILPERFPDLAPTRNSIDEIIGTSEADMGVVCAAVADLLEQEIKDKPKKWGASKPRKSLADVLKRAEHHINGPNLWPGDREFARKLGCSVALLYKAVKRSKLLRDAKQWADEQRKPLRGAARRDDPAGDKDVADYYPTPTSGSEAVSREVDPIITLMNTEEKSIADFRRWLIDNAKNDKEVVQAKAYTAEQIEMLQEMHLETVKETRADNRRTRKQKD